MKHLTELARSLCELRGISGDEARVREFIAGELQDGSTRLSMKTDPLGGPEARVVLRLTKEGMDAAKATRNSDAKLKKVAGRMKKEELEVLKQRLAALQESEFQNAEIIRFRTDPNNIEIRLTNGVIVRIFKNNNRYQIVGCSEKPPAES